MAPPSTSNPAAPARWRRTAVRFALPLGLLALGIFGMSALVAMRKPTGRVEPERTIPLVTVEAVPARAGIVRLHVDGVVVPKREITVAAEVAGRIKWVDPNFRAGRYVEEGTKLVDIDDQVYRLAFQQAEAEQAQLQADLSQLEVEAKNLAALLDISAREVSLAESNLRRARELYDPQRNIRNLTPAQYEAVEASLLKSQNAHQQLKNSQALLDSRQKKIEAQLQLAGFKLQQAQLDLDRTEIAAPISGVLSIQEVEADDFVQRGSVLFHIVDTNHVEVRSQIRADDLYWIWATRHTSAGGNLDLLYEPPRVEANIFYEVAGQRFRWDGYLSRYEGAGLESATRTVPVMFEVPQPARPGALEGPPTLIRGMYVQIEMDIEPQVPLMRLPIEALRPPNIVWTVQPGSASDGENASHANPATGDSHTAETARNPGAPSNAVTAATAQTNKQPATFVAQPPAKNTAVAQAASAPAAAFGTLRYHEVRVAKLLPDSVLIRADGSTIKPGDLVVVSPLAAGIDTMQVRFQRAAGDARPPTEAGDPRNQPQVRQPAAAEQGEAMQFPRVGGPARDRSPFGTPQQSGQVRPTPESRTADPADQPADSPEPPMARQS